MPARPVARTSRAIRAPLLALGATLIALAVLPGAASAKKLIGCSFFPSTGGTVCTYIHKNGSCTQEFGSPGNETVVEVVKCGPVWERFVFSAGQVSATAELHLSVNFQVLVKSQLGNVTKTVALGRRQKGTRHLAFGVGSLSPGTYTVVIEALPANKKPVLGPNPVTLQITSNGQAHVVFLHPRAVRGT